MRAMPGRLVLLVALYVALDFANPLMPGAACFDAGDTVDAVRGHRLRVTALPAVVGLSAGAYTDPGALE